MKRVKAYQDGQLVTLMHAEAVTEETRRAYDYECIETGCRCRMHWRRAVLAKGNTDPRPATFAKNKSSSHLDSCPRDIDRILHENIDYVTVKDGEIHVRINFPLGAAPVDRYPQRGWLSEQMMKAAENQKTIKPYPHIKDLVKFIEKNFQTLDSEAAGDIVVNYQGKSVEWRKLFKGSDRYNKLFARALNYKEDENGRTTSPIVTIVRPVKELEMNKSGKPRFECEEQHVKIDGRKQKIVPVLVCDPHERALAGTIKEIMKQGGTMIVASRPFYPGPNSIPSRFSEQRISLLVYKMEQIAPVSNTYWKVTHKPSNQADLFAPPSVS